MRIDWANGTRWNQPRPLDQPPQLAGRGFINGIDLMSVNPEAKTSSFGLAEGDPDGIHKEDLTTEMIESSMRSLDSDDDGFTDWDDNVPFVWNPDQADSDGDGVGDAGELTSVVLDRQSVLAGAVVTGVVTAIEPAPAEGLLVTVSPDWLVQLTTSI